jgi:hypothetical protein
VEFLQRGANVETDVLSAVKATLPSDLAKALDEAVPPVPGGSDGGSGSGGGGSYGVVTEEPVGMVYTADTVAASQIGGCRRGAGPDQEGRRAGGSSARGRPAGAPGARSDEAQNQGLEPCLAPRRACRLPPPKEPSASLLAHSTSPLLRFGVPW